MPPPSGEERQMLLAYKDQHYATWPDTALPALKGQDATPGGADEGWPGGGV